jgi:hypothetical protein
MIDAAVDQYAIEANKVAGDTCRLGRIQAISRKARTFTTAAKA